MRADQTSKKFFSWINLFGTASVFGAMLLISALAIGLDFLNVFEQLLGSFQTEDIIFTQYRKDRPVDSTIVVVNIGALTRAGIATEIDAINQYNPKVLGLDIFFDQPHENPLYDDMLEAALSKTKTLVLGSAVLEGKEDEKTGETIWKDSLRTCLPRFTQYAKRGFLSVLTENNDKFENWRLFVVQEKLESGRMEPSFGAEIARLYDSTAYNKLIARKNTVEMVNYHGNLNKFVFLDVEDIAGGRITDDKLRRIIEGKIVLMGFLGDGVPRPWDEDKYYSPMNPKLVGRTTPDMYGVLGHANIVSMILRGDYVNELEYMVDWDWLKIRFDIIIAVIVCYFNVYLFGLMLRNKVWDSWYAGLSKTIQIVEVMLFGFIYIFLFANYNIKVDLGLATLAVLLSADVMDLFIGVGVEQFYSFKRIKITSKSKPV